VWVFLLFLFFLCSGRLALGHSPHWLLFLISYSSRACISPLLCVFPACPVFPVIWLAGPGQLGVGCGSWALGGSGRWPFIREKGRRPAL
jgi:hypothetical protein